MTAISGKFRPARLVLAAISATVAALVVGGGLVAEHSLAAPALTSAQAFERAALPTGPFVREPSGGSGGPVALVTP